MILLNVEYDGFFVDILTPFLPPNQLDMCRIAIDSFHATLDVLKKESLFVMTEVSGRIDACPQSCRCSCVYSGPIWSLLLGPDVL